MLTTCISVVVASTGRPGALKVLTESLARQTRAADRLVIAIAKPSDIDFDPQAILGDKTRVDVVIAPKGSSSQRNFGLDMVVDSSNIVIFLDDDFVPTIWSIEGAELFFRTHSDIHAFTGRVLADGAIGPGISTEDARKTVVDWERRHPTPPHGFINRGLVGLYGCNMAFRASEIGGIRFDETLPLYGWLEDIDFASRVPGEKVEVEMFAGVHCGTKSGRETSGRRQGYSQVANPYYLWRKGTLPATFALRLASRQFLSNHSKLFTSDPWVNRSGRASGNRLALWHIITGRLNPSHILDI